MSFCDRQAIPEALVRRRDSMDDAGAREKSREHDDVDLGESSADSADSDNVSAVDIVGDD